MNLNIIENIIIIILYVSTYFKIQILGFKIENHIITFYFLTLNFYFVVEKLNFKLAENGYEPVKR